jgi:uncharacterized membrane protein YphA (DoxX/SURF4 family)
MHTIIVNILRVSIALQALGIGVEYLGIFNPWDDDSPVFSLLCFDRQWPEETAQRVDDIGAWAYLVCGLALVAIPFIGATTRKLIGRDEPLLPVALWQLPLCTTVALWQIILTTVSWYRGGSFMSEWTLASQSARIALPIALLVLTPLSRTSDVSQRSTSVAMWILRIATCLTFVAHGLKSINLHGEFTNYIISAADQVSWALSQETAEVMLRVIGGLDLVVAALIVVTRWRAVAYYMAAWALIAAFARVVHAGWGSYFEVLIRSGNYCAPFVVGLYWHLLHRAKPPTHSHHEEPTDETKLAP